MTDRTGVAQFSYPATSSAQLLFKVADSANGGSAATFQAVGSQEVTGSVTSGHFCGQPDSYTVYFAARFNRPFSSSGTWGGTSAAQVTRSPGSTSVTEHGKQEPSKKTFDIKNKQRERRSWRFRCGFRWPSSRPERGLSGNSGSARTWGSRGPGWWRAAG